MSIAALFGKSREEIRRDTVREILEPEIVCDEVSFRDFTEFVAAHYRAILAVVAVVSSVILNIYYFNHLTFQEQNVSNSRAQIESALQMRRNLLPALTVVVHQFISHEKNVFLSAVEARGKTSYGSGAGDLGQLAETLKGLTGSSPGALSRFMAEAENYPRLVSSESYQLLITRIANVENQIYEKRNEYNDAVNRYDTYLSTFPANIIGRIMGFRLQPYFEWNNEPEWVFEAERGSGGEFPIGMKNSD